MPSSDRSRSNDPVRRRRCTHGAAALCIAILVIAAPGRAQERDSIPSDVRVGIIYQPSFRPGVAVPVFDAGPGLRELADSARAIIRRDIDYTDRLEAMSIGEQVPTGGPINYDLWDELGAVWLLVGIVEGTPEAPVLRLSLHDVVYSVLQDIRSFDLPPLDGGDFRLAVHAATDEVVRWATGTPGIAATRVAYTAQGAGGSEIYMVDSDGYGARPVTRDSSIALSPVWSPDGERLAYMSYQAGDPGIYELDLSIGRTAELVNLPGLDMTPAYSPDGRQLAFAGTVEGRTELFLYDVERRCCPERITHVRYSSSLSPTFSPDGRRLAFNSDRLGQLHVFVMELPGGSGELVTPYLYDRSVHNAGPDWSPSGDRVVFHGWVEGVPQIFTVAPQGSGLRQLTQSGRNEDPSWAPDGRHVVLGSTRGGVAGLWVLDVVTGRIRALVRGGNARLPDWSGRLDSQPRQANGESVGVHGGNH